MTTRQSSELGYFVRGQAETLVGDAPLDVAATRYGIVNNLNHLQDEMTQHGGNLCCQTSPHDGTAAYFAQALTSTSTVALMDGMPPVPVWLRWNADGSSSRVVVTLRAYMTGASTGTFRVYLRPFQPDISRALSSPLAGGGGRIADITTVSTTVTTLSATVYFERLTAADLLTLPGIDAIGGVASVRLLLAQVEVWCLTSAGGTHPRIESVHVREWVG